MDALGRIVLPAGYRKQKNLPMGDILYVKPVGKNCIHNCISAPKLTKGAAACAATPFASIGE